MLLTFDLSTHRQLQCLLKHWTPTFFQLGRNTPLLIVTVIAHVRVLLSLHFFPNSTFHLCSCSISCVWCSTCSSVSEAQLTGLQQKYSSCWTHVLGLTHSELAVTRFNRKMWANIWTCSSCPTLQNVHVLPPPSYVNMGGVKMHVDSVQKWKSQEASHSRVWKSKDAQRINSTFQFCFYETCSWKKIKIFTVLTAESLTFITMFEGGGKMLIMCDRTAEPSHRASSAPGSGEGKQRYSSLTVTVKNFIIYHQQHSSSKWWLLCESRRSPPTVPGRSTWLNE